MNDSDVIIAGGGLGGLFSGALLARNGIKTIVLEKNITPGGGLQTFRRGDVIFDTGMHVMGGWRDGGTLDRLCRYLGIRAKLQIEHINDNCMDTITSLVDGETYVVPSGIDAFIEKLSSYFPSQKENLINYVAAMQRIADTFDLYNLRPYSHNVSLNLDAEAIMSTDDFIAKYITNHRLRSLLAYVNGLYGGEAGITPAYIHALISLLYIGGASRFINNSQQLANALIDVITDAGGKVLCDREVTAIEMGDDKLIKSMKCSNGEEFSAAKYIWAAHPAALLSIIPSGVFTKAYSNRISNVRNTCSAFSIYIEFHPDKFEYIAHTCYIHDDLNDSWTLSSVDRDGIPKGFMFMTPPVKNQGKFASTLVVAALMDYGLVKQWENSKRNKRPGEYEEWKNRVAEGIIDKIAKVYPNIKESIKKMYKASPLTIRDYYNAPQGSIYGFAKDCNKLLESQLPIITKVKNLYLTGQCVNLHGICGVPLTALTTAEAIIYPRTIIDRL